MPHSGSAAGDERELKSKGHFVMIRQEENFETFFVGRFSPEIEKIKSALRRGRPNGISELFHTSASRNVNARFG